VWNAGASARLAARPDVRASLEVRNLLDDRTLLDPIGNPLPGRTVLVTVRVQPSRSPHGRSSP
jgi:outer membrane receptor protein involved in Fe transport